MPSSPSQRNFIVRTVPSVRDSVVGSLMLSGIILAVAAAYLAAEHTPSASADRRPEKLDLHASPLDAPDSVPPPPVLGADLRAVLDHVARRYRVSATGLEPVFVTAHASGRELGLDPLLIIAVIAVESGFNPFAESVVGAQGMMQVMPRWHADKLPEGDDGRALLEPAFNVAVGARVLKESISRMGGLVPGLQQFAGALDDPEQGYSSRVLAEKQRLEVAARRGRTTVSTAPATPRS